MGKTNIGWVEDGEIRGGTINPQVGCTMADETCTNCYAAAMAKRLQAMGMPQYQGVVDESGNWTGQINTAHDQIEQLLRKRTNQPYFVGSMTDLFHRNSNPRTALLMLGAMILTPNNFYYVLTKRAVEMLQFFEQPQLFGLAMEALCEDFPHLKLEKRIERFWDCWDEDKFSVPQNMILGASVAVQRKVNSRIAALYLLSELGYGTWISAEPLYEAVNFGEQLDSIDWLVIGGESHKSPSKAHEFNLSWAISILAQCREHDTRCFVKQMGSNPVYAGQSIAFTGKGEDATEWPESFRVREMPRQLERWRLYAQHFVV